MIRSITLQFNEESTVLISLSDQTFSQQEQGTISAIKIFQMTLFMDEIVKKECYLYYGSIEK